MKQVLWIDINQLFVKALSVYLHSYGILISKFSSIEEAEDSLESLKDTVDIVFLGNVFPNNKTGFDVANILRNKWKISAPIVMLTTLMDEETLDNAKRSQINLILPKNINEVELHKHLINLAHLHANKNSSIVLVIDDSKFMRDKLRFELEAGNYTVLEAKDGYEGIKLAEQYKPHYIILDVEMPGLSGYETCSKLKEIPEVFDIPVIFFSATNDVDARQKALDVGGVEFFPKNAQSGDLLHFITDLKNKSGLERYKNGLYIEDNITAQHVVEYTMAKEGYNIYIAETIAQAEEILRKEKVDFVLCDLYIKDEKATVFSFIRKHTTNQEDFVPLIMVSGSQKRDDLLVALNAGATDYIKKPFVTEELLLRIRNQVKVKEMLEEKEEK